MSGTYCNHKRLGGDIVDALSETRIVRDGNLELQDRDGSNAVIRDYVWGLHLGGGIGGLLDIRESSNNYHPLYDGKGNITALSNTAGTIVAQYRYGSFGKLEAKTGSIDQPFGFSTKRTDPKTGLVYYGYRFYHPDMERWLNRDPIGERGGINLYGFVGNNPINWIDPWGLMILPECPAGLGPEWYRDFTHRHPYGERWRHPSGDFLDWNKAQPGAGGHKEENHWHYNDGQDHLKPGTEIPDPDPNARKQLIPPAISRLLRAPVILIVIPAVEAALGKRPQQMN